MCSRLQPRATVAAAPCATEAATLHYQHCNPIPGAPRGTEPCGEHLILRRVAARAAGGQCTLCVARPCRRGGTAAHARSCRDCTGGGERGAGAGAGGARRGGGQAQDRRRGERARRRRAGASGGCSGRGRGLREYRAPDPRCGGRVVAGREWHHPRRGGTASGGRGGARDGVHVLGAGGREHGRTRKCLRARLGHPCGAPRAVAPHERAPRTRRLAAAPLAAAAATFGGPCGGAQRPRGRDGEAEGSNLV